MKKNRIKRKKLRKKELKNSFLLISPVTGRLLSLDFSNDVIMRRGDMGIGFIIDNFEEDMIVAPNDGTLFGNLDMGTGIIILNSIIPVLTIIKVTGFNEGVKNQGIETLIQNDSEVIKKGTPILKIDRDYLMYNKYQFQLTVTFKTFYKKKSSLSTKDKFDILYSFKRDAKSNVNQRDKLGYIYKVEKDLVLDLG